MKNALSLSFLSSTILHFVIIWSPIIMGNVSYFFFNADTDQQLHVFNVNNSYSAFMHTFDWALSVKTLLHSMCVLEINWVNIG